MAATLAPARQTRAPQLSIQTLEPDDIPMLRLPGLRGAQALRREIERYPGRSVWAPATLEFAVVGPWRNRPEIACVNELVAVRHAESLLRAAFERCASSRRRPAPRDRARIAAVPHRCMSAPAWSFWKRSSPTKCQLRASLGDRGHRCATSAFMTHDEHGIDRGRGSNRPGGVSLAMAEQPLGVRCLPPHTRGRSCPHRSRRRASRL